MGLPADGRNQIIITVVLSVLATILVVLRISMRRAKAAIGADDWLLLFAVFMLYLQDIGAVLRESKAMRRQFEHIQLTGGSCGQRW